MKEFKDWAMMAPMKYYDKKRDELSEALQKKHDAMTNNENDEYIATIKWDGEWTMFIKWNEQTLIRSRSISKVTGAYGDKTEHLPHLVEEMKTWPNNTVILGEVCWGEYGTVSTDVGTILRCLPKKAVERQKEKKLIVKAFDILAYAGEEYMNVGYEDRYNMLDEILFSGDDNETTHYFTITPRCPDDITPAEFADEVISQGGEGVVIQRKDYIYEPGKRTAWKTLKLKQRLPQMELKVVGVLEPKREYNGDCISSWSYFEIEASEENETNEFVDLSNEKEVIAARSRHPEHSYWMPVTKPYFMGWKNGITVELEDGERCDVASGLTDADREWLATDEAAKMIANGELYAVIQAMQINTKGKLRHPALVRLRTDM